MAAAEGDAARAAPPVCKPSEEFVAYCETEFERRLNAGQAFDEASYRRAMALVVEHLARMEEEGARR
jgi:hypothetical protein